eukprot:COSAG01_NODE_300_length_19226_cov_41.536519_25_plen_294_part_00
MLTAGAATPASSKGAVIRKATLDALNRSVVRPAAEVRKEVQDLLGKKRARVSPTAADSEDDSDYESDVEADNTACGAEGTSAAFIARRERMLVKRRRKAAKKEKAAAEREQTRVAKAQEAMIAGAAIERAKAPGADAAKLGRLVVKELRMLIVARGGAAPKSTTKKPELVSLVAALPPIAAHLLATAAAAAMPAAAVAPAAPVAPTVVAAPAAAAPAAAAAAAAVAATPVESVAAAAAAPRAAAAPSAPRVVPVFRRVRRSTWLARSPFRALIAKRGGGPGGSRRQANRGRRV